MWERVRKDKTERNAQTWLRHVGVMCKMMVPRTNVGQLRSTRERMPGRGMCKNICRTRFGEGGVQRNDGEKRQKKERKGEKELRDGGGYLGWVMWLKNSLEEGQMGLDWSYVMGGGDKFVAWDMDGVSGGVVVISCQC